MEALEEQIFEDVPEVPEEFLNLSTQELRSRVRLIDNEIRVLKDENQRLSLEQAGMKERIKDNKEKVSLSDRACKMYWSHMAFIIRKVLYLAHLFIT